MVAPYIFHRILMMTSEGDNLGMWTMLTPQDSHKGISYLEEQLPPPEVPTMVNLKQTFAQNVGKSCRGRFCLYGVRLVSG